MIPSDIIIWKHLQCNLMLWLEAMKKTESRQQTRQKVHFLFNLLTHSKYLRVIFVLFFSWSFLFIIFFVIWNHINVRRFTFAQSVTTMKRPNETRKKMLQIASVREFRWKENYIANSLQHVCVCMRLCNLRWYIDLLLVVHLKNWCNKIQ